jgi:CRP/FNR family cyclic AMP-dependent transcriptional regulator
MDTLSFFSYPSDSHLAEQEGLLFMREADEADWDVLLSYATTQRFHADEQVITAGDKDDSLLLIGAGDLEVLIPSSRGRTLKQLTVIRAGSVIGEQSFFDQQPRSTHIRALSDGELYRLSREKFMVLSAKNPQLARMLLLDLGKIISLRLRQTTLFLSQVSQ